MSQTEKERLISDVISLLQERLPETTPEPPAPIEMISVKECVELIKGLSIHTVRQLITQEKIPSLRTGCGKGGKILVNKAEFLRYFGRKEVQQPNE